MVWWLLNLQGSRCYATVWQVVERVAARKVRKLSRILHSNGVCVCCMACMSVSCNVYGISETCLFNILLGQDRRQDRPGRCTDHRPPTSNCLFAKSLTSLPIWSSDVALPQLLHVDMRVLVSFMQILNHSQSHTLYMDSDALEEIENECNLKCKTKVK